MERKERGGEILLREKDRMEGRGERKRKTGEERKILRLYSKHVIV